MLFRYFVYGDVVCVSKVLIKWMREREESIRYLLWSILIVIVKLKFDYGLEFCWEGFIDNLFIFVD